LAPPPPCDPSRRRPLVTAWIYEARPTEAIGTTTMLA
jgi:hypothetical protein